MCCQALGADYSIAWPTADIAVMGAESSANIIFRKEIAAAEDPEAKRQEKIAEYREHFSGPYEAAKLGYIEDIVEPGETRVRLVAALEALRDKKQEKPRRKHGNIPL